MSYKNFESEIERILSQMDVSDITRYHYRRHVMQFVEFVTSTFGSFDPHNITRAEVQAYVDHLENSGLSPSSVSHHLSAVIRFGKEAGNNLDYRKIRHTKPGKPLSPKSLDRNERNRLLRDVSKTRNRRNIAIIYMLLFTGLRVSELCALNIQDLKMSERSGTVHVRRGKGNKERFVPMPHEARTAVMDYLKHDRPGETEGPLFKTNRGTRLQPRTVQRLCMELGTHPHALRHTYCRMLVASGADLVTVAALAGHQNVNTTAIYAQPTEAEKEAAVSKAFNQGI